MPLRQTESLEASDGEGMKATCWWVSMMGYRLKVRSPGAPDAAGADMGMVGEVGLFNENVPEGVDPYFLKSDDVGGVRADALGDGVKARPNVLMTEGDPATLKLERAHAADGYR